MHPDSAAYSPRYRDAAAKAELPPDLVIDLFFQPIVISRVATEYRQPDICVQSSVQVPMLTTDDFA